MHNSKKHLMISKSFRYLDAFSCNLRNNKKMGELFYFCNFYIYSNWTISLKTLSLAQWNSKTKSSNVQSLKWDEYQYSLTNRFFRFLKKHVYRCKKTPCTLYSVQCTFRPPTNAYLHIILWIFVYQSTYNITMNDNMQSFTEKMKF